MADYCKDCARLEISGACKWGDEYYCEKLLKYISKSHIACSDFVKRPSGGYKRAGFEWYIVTKICQMLNMGMDSTLYKGTLPLREYMNTTLEGQNFLNEYDEVGPKVAQHLSQETSLYAASIASRFLMPVIESINANDFDTAFNIYYNMVNELTQQFGIPFSYNLEVQEECFDAKLARRK